MSRNCPQKRQTATINKATVLTPKPKGKREKTVTKPKMPPTYKSLLKQINACSMDDQQKLLEVFSNADEEEEQDF